MQLISLSATNKIRVIDINLIENEDNTYTITRRTGQLNGKMTEQPSIFIEKGKAKRTIEEQATLEFNSHVKKYKDKGYKEIPGTVDQYKEEDLRKILPENNTDANDVLKPMLAKQEDKITNRKIFNNKWYASRKIDGVRCIMYYRDGKIRTASRGGGHYDYATSHLREHPLLIKYFKKHPTIILDSELYKHGKQLQQISGAARLEKNAVDCDWLELYVYDIVDINKTFEERLKVIEEFKFELNLSFNPLKEWNSGDLQIQVVPHVEVSGWDNIMALHNDWVEEGFEGCVIRDPKKPYKPAGRTNYMIKVKKYHDGEFLVKGFELGLRGSEDMVFICETPSGLTFKAKPHGTRETRQWYVDNFEKECLNKMATVKYFYYSNGNNEITGVPLQGQVVCMRTYE